MTVPVRNFTTTCLVVLLLCLGGAGTAPAADTAFSHGLLWRIEAPGDGRPSYLFGTIHIADPRVLEIPAPVAAAFESCDVAVFEVLLTGEALQRQAQVALYDNGRTLDGEIGADLFARVAQVAMSYGMDSAMVRRYKPWALTMTFSMPAEQVRLYAATGVVLDLRLQEMARRAGMELRQLETFDEQIAILETQSEADQFAMLAAVVDHKDEVDRAFEMTLRLYLERDLAAIAELETADLGGLDPAVTDRFLALLKTGRDRRMFERLEPMLAAQGGIFVAVGTLHLIGESGLLQRLTDAGYTVTEVY